MVAIKSIFSDGASLILKAMMAQPNREWVVRDFVKELGVGRGWAGDVLSVLRQKGFVKGVSRGRMAGTTLRNPEDVVREWVKHYDVACNETHLYYSADPDIFSQIKEFFNEQQNYPLYALTLHSGANLITSYVRDPNIYIYLDSKRFDELSFSLRKALDLKELKSGGNIYLMNPYYKRSVQFGIRKIKGISVVSNLQLYLDLYHYPRRGLDHAEYLARFLKRKGEGLV